MNDFILSFFVFWFGFWVGTMQEKINRMDD